MNGISTHVAKKTRIRKTGAKGLPRANREAGPAIAKASNMLSRHPGPDAHLKLVARDREVIATAIRERRVTNRRGTGITYRWWIALSIALVAACGGGKRPDTYARGADVQGQCCEHLQGGARDQCLSGVVRVDDRGVASTPANQATYACVVDHFVCDPASGHPTQPSAQAQLECIQDLQ